MFDLEFNGVGFCDLAGWQTGCLEFNGDIRHNPARVKTKSFLGIKMTAEFPSKKGPSNQIL